MDMCAHVMLHDTSSNPVQGHAHSTDSSQSTRSQGGGGVLGWHPGSDVRLVHHVRHDAGHVTPATCTPLFSGRDSAGTFIHWGIYQPLASKTSKHQTKNKRGAKAASQGGRFKRIRTEGQLQGDAASSDT